MGVQLSGAGSGAAAALAAGAGALLTGTVADSGCMCIGVRANGLLPLVCHKHRVSAPATLTL